MSTQRVPLSQLLPPTANPRKRIDPAGIEGLAQSIQTDGVLQNLVVKCLKGDRFRVVTGERRYRALRVRNKTDVERLGGVWQPLLFATPYGRSSSL